MNKYTIPVWRIARLRWRKYWPKMAYGTSGQEAISGEARTEHRTIHVWVASHRRIIQYSISLWILLRDVVAVVERNGHYIRQPYASISLGDLVYGLGSRALIILLTPGLAILLNIVLQAHWKNR
jgi:hypothetical protein